MEFEVNCDDTSLVFQSTTSSAASSTRKIRSKTEFHNNELLTHVASMVRTMGGDFGMTRRRDKSNKFSTTTVWFSLPCFCSQSGHDDINMVPIGECVETILAATPGDFRAYNLHTEDETSVDVFRQALLETGCIQ